MRVLITNDDGVDAEGLAVAQRIAEHFADDIWIVAPSKERSGSGCSLSFSDPMRLEQKGAQKYAVEGTPVDCVMIAIQDLMKDTPPDLVISGVNRGQNIAEDLIYSGTVGGAIQGCLLGVPSLALSQAFGFSGGLQNIYWQTAEHYAPDLIAKLLRRGWDKEALININFPDRALDEVEGISVTEQGRRDFPLLNMERRHDPRRRPYYWLDFHRSLFAPAAGSDLHALYSGRISITPISLHLTHKPLQQSLSADLNDSFDMISSEKQRA